jgi:hypothetical protein
METNILEEALDYLNKHATHGWKRIETFEVSPSLCEAIKDMCKEENKIIRYRGYKLNIDDSFKQKYGIRIKQYTEKLI